MLFGRAGFSEPSYKGLEVISSAVHQAHVGGICLGRLALWLFPQLQRPDVPLCKDVLIWAFTLTMTRLLCKHEMNWMFLAFLNGELGEHSAWLILPPTLYLFPNGALAKSISCGQVTHRDLCSKPKSSLLKIWCFSQQCSWRIAPVVSLLCWHFHWE